MRRLLREAEIEALLAEEKALPARWRQRLFPQKDGNPRRHLHSQIEFDGVAGNRFRLVVRRSRHNPLDFSVILLLLERGEEYRLRRHNGKHSSRHTNRYEQQRGEPGSRLPSCFHIHKATERYQLEDLAIDDSRRRLTATATSRALSHR
jgi:hypothetical protein